MNSIIKNKMFNKQIKSLSKHLFRKYGLRSANPTIQLMRCLSSVHIKPSYAQTSEAYAKPSYIHNPGKDALIYHAIGQELERAVSIYGSNEAIVSCHENKRHTFRTLLDNVDRVAAGFLKMGLKRGDHVGIWGPNSMQWYLTMLGAARAGLISVGLNPAFQAPEIDYCLKKVNVKAVVIPETYKTQNFYEILKSICPELPHSEAGKIKSQNLPHLQAVIIEGKTKLKGAFSFDEILDLPSTSEQQQISTLQKLIMPCSPCNVQFTSGTTGQPKAATLTHYNFVNNGIHIGNRNKLENARICVQVPLFHAFGVVISIMAALSKGATLVMPAAGFNPEESLRAVIKEKCTVIHGTPTMYVDLIKKQSELKLPLNTLKMAVTGGAICSPQLFLNIKNELGVEQVRTVFGMTECSAVIFQSREGDTMEQVLNTVGYIQDHVEAKVIDKEGHTVPFGEPGELCVRGYVTMLGYHGEEGKTKEVLGPCKWLRTGDQFVLQEDGYGRIVGRLKEMIIRGGENIFPKEVEDFLNTHPQIIENHVIGVPDERMGEELCVFVRLEDGVENLTRKELKEYCKGKLSHYKVPRYVVPVKEFPKTTSGKIQKFKLLELFKQLNA
ncbi:medium-chain acyl-CoA ligase ACSF2, mitochondrial-like [Teleopsis dalmanni]|uniref:medium-chain acyl-CoA ligase ACSF2, mitochondrial-like n=1 Tax=Teleopsis dalmanni TaxID=139649 RepID=UPI0018CD129F|nr:medium-chain acyl-CoA ligase ACSF2, mitochondrial-like [Teleopsis dalmanni]